MSTTISDSTGGQLSRWEMELQDATPQTNGPMVTIVTHRPGCTEIPWVRFLLGDLAGEIVDDPDRRLVVPYSLVISDRPDLIKNKTLTAVRRVGTVGLLHIGDRRYRSRLGAYPSFGFVWRTYYHSGLVDIPVRQLPLGPAAVAEITPEPWPVALRQPAERLYTWSFAGQLTDTRDELLEAFRQVEGGHEVITGGPDWSDRPAPDPATTLEVLADSVFVPCGGDEGHLESARIYDALEVGAIPIVERRRWLDYFHELFGEHPLPTVRTWADAPALVEGLLADQTALHQRVVDWWTMTKNDLAEAAQMDIRECFVTMMTSGERDGTPLERPAPRWRGQIEMLRHRPPRRRARS
jgi:hypothetical protein